MFVQSILGGPSKLGCYVGYPLTRGDLLNDQEVDQHQIKQGEGGRGRCNLGI